MKAKKLDGIFYAPFLPKGKFLFYMIISFFCFFFKIKY